MTSVTATHANKRTISLEYDFGDDLAATTALFTDEIVHRNAVQQMTVALQGFIRTKLGKDGDEKISDKAIEKLVAEWKPGLRTPGKSKVDKAKDLLADMSDEDRAALLASLS